MTARIADDLKNRALRLKRSTITFPLKKLSPNDRKALVKLIKAADLMSEIFLRQVSPLNPKTREALQSARNKLSHEALAYFQINFGP